MRKSNSALFIVFLIISLNVVSFTNEFSFKKARFNKIGNNNLSAKDDDNNMDETSQNEVQGNQDNYENKNKEQEEIVLDEKQVINKFDLMIEQISNEFAEIEALDTKPENFDELKAQFEKTLERLKTIKNKQVQAIKDIIEDETKHIEEEEEQIRKRKEKKNKFKDSKEDKEERKAAKEIKKLLKENEKQIKNNESTDFLQLSTTTGVTKAQAATYTSACLKGVMASIPPSFCMKKNGDAGKIPTGCPSGWFRSAALCYEKCKSGYNHVLGVCWQSSCPSGYADHGATCFKWNWFKSRTIWKHSYIPASMTNLDSRIPCPYEHYKSGALCYRNCNKAGLVNCGIGACAASGETCAMGITTMAVDFILSLTQAVSFVLTFGATSVAVAGFAAARTAFANTNKNIAKNALKNMYANMMRTIVKNRIKAAAKAYAKTVMSNIGQNAANNVVTAVCNSVTDRVINDSAQGLPSTLSLESLEPTGIANAVKTCGSTSTENEQILCAKSVLGAVSTVDVTGLTGMAAALIQEVCPWV